MKSDHNPIRWDCDKTGCFNRKLRPKLEYVNDLLPGNICFSDIDGVVERDGQFLFLEWKCGEGTELPRGQRIMYGKMGKSGNMTVLVVYGDAETMEVTHIETFYKSKCYGKVKSDLIDLRKAVWWWTNEVVDGKQPDEYPELPSMPMALPTRRLENE